MKRFNLFSAIENAMKQMSAEALLTDPAKSYRFKVKITMNNSSSKVFNGTTSMLLGFQKVSGLKVKVDVAEYREGGDRLENRKLPGIAKFDPVTLERGYTSDGQLWSWFTSLYNPNTGEQANDADFKALAEVYLLDRDGKSVIRYWRVINAWVSDYESGDFDASSNTVFIQKATMQIDRFEEYAAGDTYIPEGSNTGIAVPATCPF